MLLTLPCWKGMGHALPSSEELSAGQSSSTEHGEALKGTGLFQHPQSHNPSPSAVHQGITCQCLWLVCDRHHPMNIRFRVLGWWAGGRELGSEGVQETIMAHQDAWVALRKSLGTVGPCPILHITGAGFSSSQLCSRDILKWFYFTSLLHCSSSAGPVDQKGVVSLLRYAPVPSPEELIPLVGCLQCSDMNCMCSLWGSAWQSSMVSLCSWLRRKTFMYA